MGIISTNQLYVITIIIIDTYMYVDTMTYSTGTIVILHGHIIIPVCRSGLLKCTYIYIDDPVITAL